MRNLVVVVPSNPKSKSKWWLLTNLSIAEGFSANMDFSGCYCNTLFIEALKRFNFSCPHNKIAYNDRRISWRACFDTALHGVIHVRRSSGIRSKQSPEKKISSRKYCHVVIALLCVVSPPFLQSSKCSGVLAGHTWETKSSNVVSSLLLLCVACAVIPPPNIVECTPSKSWVTLQNGHEGYLLPKTDSEVALVRTTSKNKID